MHTPGDLARPGQTSSDVMVLRLSEAVVILVSVRPLALGLPERLAALAADGPRNKRGMAAQENPSPASATPAPVSQGDRATVRPPQAKAPAAGPATAAGTGEAGLQPGAQELIAAMESQLDSNLEHRVEQCLQHLSEYTWLGQSELAAELLIEGDSPIARGKAVRVALLNAIESLRPASTPPSGARCAPREWHSYTVLHDAYVEDVPNRDIMSSLYISEGTFSRRRREALRAVAGTLMAAKRSAIAALPNLPPQAR